jgi:hypothetical protein
MTRITGKIGFTAVCGVVWALVIGAGVVQVAQYENTPGTSASIVLPPADERLPLATDRATLIMFVHPKCPCSDASMAELAELMTKCAKQPAATVVFFRPTGQSDDWVKTRLWSAARAIPRVRTVIDADGALAKQFDAQTSGQVFLYEPDGRLAFSGGITGSRGHAGDNAGADALAMLLDGQLNLYASAPIQAPVFGCQILESSTTRP